MIRKKGFALLCLALALLALALVYFFLPRPVIKDPDNAAIIQIAIQRHPHYQKDASDSFIWMPETEADQAVAKEIVTYLSQCQERRTLRTTMDNDSYPLYWKCMYILVDTDANNTSTFSRARGILLGPTQFSENDEPAHYEKTVNLSYYYLGSGIWNRFQGDLVDPDSLRTFVLDALDLPADFL